jgi:hypothetical protein
MRQLILWDFASSQKYSVKIIDNVESLLVEDLSHDVHILEMNGKGYWLATSKKMPVRSGTLKRPGSLAVAAIERLWSCLGTRWAGSLPPSRLNGSGDTRG